jgi:hypothetical protein
MRKTTHKQQPTSSTESLIKTGKKRDIELAEDELSQVTGGETKIIITKTTASDPTLSTKQIDVSTDPIKSKY